MQWSSGSISTGWKQINRPGDFQNGPKGLVKSPKQNGRRLAEAKYKNGNAKDQQEDRLSKSPQRTHHK